MARSHITKGTDIQAYSSTYGIDETFELLITCTVHEF